MKQFLKSIPVIGQLNGWQKRRLFRQQEQKMQAHYNALSAPIPVAVQPAHSNPGASVRSIFLVGTNEAQDRSGMFQALGTLSEDFGWFTKRDGSYGLEFPKSPFDKELRARNSARLRQLISERDTPPDLIVGQMMGINTDPAVLDDLRAGGTRIINVAMDDRLPDLWIPGNDGTRRGAIELAGSVDITFTTCADRVSWYRKEGHRAAPMTLAGDGSVENSSCPRDIPVSFIGNRYGHRGELIENVRRAGIPIEVFGRGWENGPVNATEAARINAKSKIILGSGLVGHMSDVYTLKLRDFDALLSGACYVTHRNPDLLRLFEEGRHLYCYENTDELTRTLRKCLDDPVTTAETAARGEAFAREHYTWEKVLRDIIAQTGLIL